MGLFTRFYWPNDFVKILRFKRNVSYLLNNYALVSSSVMVGNATSHFRSSIWDPSLLIAQILAVQCAYYMSLGVWLVLLMYVVGRYVSIALIFDYKVCCSATCIIARVFE